MNLKEKYQVQNTYGPFLFKKVLPIEALQLVLYELIHQPTGARVVHLETNDLENLFSLSFQTCPNDSTGAAHILEHVVLCGSKKFPVKDPFFSMSRRSLNTFMNAMTGADFTCYPAASQVEKDFYNLLEVYLDAVFHPELKKLSFLQEGHRLEFDPELVYKGIVYNEMKGSLSNPDSRLWHALIKHLTPDLTYAFNSGGDPADIPNLTYEMLQAFHATYYHPSRCLFFFYGNLPLEKHLDFIQTRALKGAERLPPLENIPRQPRFKTPQIKRGYYPAKEGKEFVCLAWLTTPIADQEETLALAVLDSILMETDASLLKYPLLQSKLCTQAESALDCEMSEIPYAIICRGCEEKKGGEIEALIIQTLEKICAEGIPQETIEAALHQLEFSRLEIARESGPFGLTLFMRTILPMHHGCPPETALSLSAHFHQVRLLAKGPTYFPSLIRRYLLSNPHRLLYTFAPDPTLEKREEEEEKKKLQALESSLTEKEKEEIKLQTAALKQFQEKTEVQSIACLPSLALSDVPKDTQEIPLSQETRGDLTIFHHRSFTNHILYAKLLFDLPKICAEELPYLQLFCTLLPELGAGKRTYLENLKFLNAYLGDLSASIDLFSQVEKPNLLQPTLALKGKALQRNADKLFQMLIDLCEHLDLTDTARIQELILQIYTSLENRLNRNALSYAIQRSIFPYTQNSFLGEHFSGLAYFRFMRTLVQNLDQTLPTAMETLHQLKERLFHRNTPHLVLTCSDAQYQTLQKAQFYQLGSLEKTPLTPWTPFSLPPFSLAEAYPISSPVAFSAFALKGPTIQTKAAPFLSLSTHLLENTFLHKKIREQGGAYSTGAQYHPLSGHYLLYSYRDPHIAKTYQAFEEGLTHLARGNFSERDLTEAKFGIIQDLDLPVSPGYRGSLAYRYLREGQTRDIRQTFRTSLLSATKKDIEKAVESHLAGKKGNRVTFSSKPLIESQNSSLTILSL